MSKKKQIVQLRAEAAMYAELLAGSERAEAESEASCVRLRHDAKRGRLVIMYAKAGEHLVPVYDELVQAADVTVDNDFIDATVFGGAAKEYLVGPSTITIRVTK